MTGTRENARRGPWLACWVLMGACVAALGAFGAVVYALAAMERVRGGEHGEGVHPGEPSVFRSTGQRRDG